MEYEFDFYTGNIDRFMDIARKQLDYIKKRQSGELKIPGIIEDHGVVTSIFAAASIEAAINLYILLPVVYIKNSKTRIFFGSLLTKYFRSPISVKLKFICKTFPELKKNKKLLKKVGALFSYRNLIMHSAPDHVEESDYYFEDEDSRKHLNRVKKTSPRFYFGSNFNSEEEIKLAQEHFDIAEEFIEKMRPFRPKKLTKKEINLFENLIN
jgi:hypothetical protein